MILETIDNCFGTIYSAICCTSYFLHLVIIVNLFIYTLYYDIKVTSFFFTGRVPEVFGHNFIVTIIFILYNLSKELYCQDLFLEISCFHEFQSHLSQPNTTELQ